MRLKHKVIVNKKEYFVWELTVGLFLIFLQDSEQFFENLFIEFNTELPKMNEFQIQKLLEEYFEQKEKINSKINDSTQKTLEIIQINIWKFIKHIGWTYQDIINMPFRVFVFMLDNINVIAGEEKFIFSEDKQKEMKKSLKDLFHNQK